MKINRSTNLSLKFISRSKQKQLEKILTEYGRVVNSFIELFWDKCPNKRELLKPVVDSSVSTWLSARLRKVAAREAISMVTSSRNRDGEDAIMPTHKGLSMSVSSTIADLQPAEKTTQFDAWLHIQSAGNHLILDLPVKLHRHYNKLAERGRRLNSYVITKDNVQLCFKIETGPKKQVKTAIGIDTGIKALASLSNGEQLGTDIERNIDKIIRCKKGSNGKHRAQRALKQRIDEIAKSVSCKADLIVVEKLKNITKNTKVKRRLTKTMRRSIGSWNVRYWLDRLQQRCEDNRVVFRSVPAFNTSIECPSCGYTDRKNRDREMFRCQRCNHTDNADVNAARNILSRLLLGPYGAEFKAVAV